MDQLRLRSAVQGIVCLIFALGSASTLAQSNVAIYGIADAGLELSNHGKGSLTRVVSGGQFASRLGFRGSEDLGDGLAALFRLEMGLNLDDGTLGQGGRIFGREAIVGLRSSRWGEVSLGRGVMPYYYAQSAVDAFVWSGSGGLLALTRGGGTVQQLLPLVVSGRLDNSVNYASPLLSGLQLRAQAAAAEGSTTIGRGYGASARYTGGAWDVVAAMARQQGAGNVNGAALGYVLGGSYTLPFGRAYVGYTREHNTCSTCTGPLTRGAGLAPGGASDFRMANLGMRIPVDLFNLMWQVTRVQDRSDYLSSPGSRDATWLAVGGEYLLSKRTSVYASIGTAGNSNGSAYALGTGSAQQPAGVVAAGDPRAKAMSVGLRHSF